jgi:hypothetical protein
MKVKLLMIAEIEIEGAEGAVDEAQAKLDAFREAVLPLENYGIALSAHRWTTWSRASSWPAAGHPMRTSLD